MIAGNVPPPLLVDMPPDMPMPSDPNCKERPLFIFVTEAGDIWFQDKPVETETLVDTLRAVTSRRTCGSNRVYIVAAEATPYARIEQVLSMLKWGGLLAVGLVAPYNDY